MNLQYSSSHRGPHPLLWLLAAVIVLSLIALALQPGTAQHLPGEFPAIDWASHLTSAPSPQIQPIQVPPANQAVQPAQIQVTPVPASPVLQPIPRSVPTPPSGK